MSLQWSRKLSSEEYLPALLGVAMLALAVFGWRLLYFLTDDAFIAFRFVSNRMEGWGWVWNPPPFAPVEGYTSFLWVLILELVWRLLGIEPPDCANVLSLLAGIGTLYLVYRFIMRMSLRSWPWTVRFGLAALVLLGTIVNRTFLTWLSSGLETALFNLLFTWWVYEAFTGPSQRSAGWAARLSTSAALASLARPDGLLLVLGTLPVLATEIVQRRARSLVLFPLTLPVLHSLWRKHTYGEWLPNTYYAKVFLAWPEAGVRYAGSFILEYGVWVWIGLLLVAAWRVPWRSLWPPRERGSVTLPRWVGVGVLVVHLAYYTFYIGGDHFEYRVYSHLVPLLFVSAVAVLAFLSARPIVAASVLALFILASVPIPWVHFSLTHSLTARAETHVLVRPISHLFPPPFRQVVARWDRWQAWLIPRHVCMRHQEHKVFCEYQLARLPTREEGRAAYPLERHHVLAQSSVGVLGWVLPEVAIIDTLGLTDRVVAKNHPDSTANHEMAHDRRPPPGYVECFRPTLFLESFGPITAMARRSDPIRDDEIQACESRPW